MKKIGDSFKGILGGIIFIIIGIVLLWWNEGNNVRNLKTTAEMSKSYIDVSSETVNAENEGKLIATSGSLINEQELSDDIFNVKVVTPVLRRVVEVYQWVEESEDDNGDTRYTYKKEWNSTLIDSANFHNSGHNNPTTKPYEDQTYTSTDVKVGAFTLSSNQVNMLSTEGVFSTYDEETITNLGYTIAGRYATNSADINNPQIGDVRISFEYNNSTEVSVLAVQAGNSFVDFVSKAGKSINRVMDGKHSGAEMIEVIKKENKILKWILRLVGTLLIVGGIASMLKPISTVAGFVPILGSIVGSAVGLVSFILGLAISLVIIAIAWIRFRPVLGIILLAVVAALVVFLVLRGKKNPGTPVTPSEPTTENNQN